MCMFLETKETWEDFGMSQALRIECHAMYYWTTIDASCFLNYKEVIIIITYKQLVLNPNLNILLNHLASLFF